MLLFMFLLNVPAVPLADYPTIPISFPYTEDPPDYQTIRTGMEYGYVQTRAKTTSAPRTYELSHDVCTSVDRSAWLTFWNTQLGGSRKFNFTDPNTAAVVVCRFDESVKPKILRTSPNTFTIGPIRVEEAL